MASGNGAIFPLIAAYFAASPGDCLRMVDGRLCTAVKRRGVHTQQSPQKCRTALRPGLTTRPFVRLHTGGVIVTVQLPEAPPVLNHSTRCDRCGARAYVVVILRRSRRLPRGGELLFCVHHWREWAKHINPAAVIDESAQLLEHITDDKHWVEGMRIGQK